MAEKTRTQDEMAQERTLLSEQRTGMASKRTDMAYKRTDLAFERTSLANSQTLLSYFRTAIATFAAGIGMFEFISSQTIVHIGIVLMAVSPVMAAIGVIHYSLVRRRLAKLHQDGDSCGDCGDCD